MNSPLVSRISTDAPYGSDVVASPRPTIGWMTETDTVDWVQARAEVEMTAGSETSVHVVDGPEQVRIAWPFPPLAPRDRCALRVRVQGRDGTWSSWSESRVVVAGFLAEGEWQAETIAVAEPSEHGEPAVLNVDVDFGTDIAAVWLYAASVGVYQVAVNGADVDDQVMKPGWTAYQERVIHESTDVTALVRDGQNAVSVRLAGGWATELYGFAGNWHPIFATQPTFAAQFVVTRTDGSETVIVTDGSWSSTRGPLVASSLYHGEHHDARVVDTAPVPVPVTVVEPMPVPEARVSPFVRRIEDIAVEAVIETPSGARVLDFGQNLVGRLRLRVSGPAGTAITLRHAEVLEHGELGVRPLREARATDVYVLSGEGIEIWEPEFTFHGFRYAEVSGWPGDFDPADVTAVVIHSDMERTGWFETSHPLVSRLHENVVWGLRGNFLSVPTDCPQRDERLGWTGDIQVFAPTASFLYDVRGFLDSWLTDLAIDQVDGVVPFVVPNVLGPAQPAAAWGDAATVVPEVLYDRFGDLDTLRRQYPSMVGWTDDIARRSGHRLLWEGAFQFGDWLDPDAPPQNAAKAKTDPDIVATAYLFKSATITARAAGLLGLDEDARRYAELAERVRSAFLAEYVTPAGRMVSDAQTAYALAIAFGIIDDDRRAAAGDRLAQLTRANGFHIGTGFVGTPIIQDALTDTGHGEQARRLLLQTENPSWLYPVTMGATTIWERWDSMLPDGTINPGEMTSFNHYALGAIADWLQRRVAGLAPAEPGYRALRIAPMPLAGLDDASATHLTPYGLARAGWVREGADIIVDARVPAGATADVVLPDGTIHAVGSGTYRWVVPAPASAQVPREIGLETPLAVVIEDEEAHTALMARLNAVDAGAADIVRSATGWGAGTNVGQLLASFVGGDLREVVAADFARITQTRAAG